MREVGVEGSAEQTQTPSALLHRLNLTMIAPIVVGTLLLWFSFPSLTLLHALWTQSYNYSHGYLVLALSGFLVVRELRRAPLAPFVPSWLGVASVACLMLVMVAGQASTTLFLTYAPLPAIWLAAVWAVAGAGTARRLLLPLGYLYCAIPIWDVAIEPLRGLTVVIVSAWIRLSAVPAFIDGNLIHLTSGTIEVAGGCSGVRYAVVALTLAGFMALLQHRRLCSMLSLMTFAVALGLLGNWLRVFIIVLVGHYSQMQHSLIVHGHASLGWGLFVVCMLPLFVLNMRFAGTPDAILNAEAPRAAPYAARFPSAVAYVACGLVIGSGLALSYRVESVMLTSPGPVLTTPEVPGWTRVGDWHGQRMPVFVGSAGEAASWYADGTARIGLYIAEYPVQQQQREVVFMENRPQGQLGTITASTRVDVASSSGARLPVRELEVADSETERRLVWLQMRVAGIPAASNLNAKLLQVWGALRGRHDAQAVVLTAECSANCDTARSWLSRYAGVALDLVFAAANTSRNPPIHQALRAPSDEL